MIERQSGFIIFHCDSCPETHDTESEDFDPAWAEAKQSGWRAYKQKNSAGAAEWFHSCPSCVEDFKDRA